MKKIITKWMIEWLKRNHNTKYQAMWRPAKDSRVAFSHFKYEWEVDQFIERVKENATFSQTIRVSLITIIPNGIEIDHNYRLEVNINPVQT